MSWEHVTSRSSLQKLYLQDTTPHVLAGEQAVLSFGTATTELRLLCHFPVSPSLEPVHRAFFVGAEQVIGMCVDEQTQTCGQGWGFYGMPEPVSANPNSRPPLGFSTNAAASRKPCPAPLPDTYKLRCTCVILITNQLSPRAPPRYQAG